MTPSCVNDLTCSSCGDWIASATCDINPFVDVRGEGSDHLPARRPPPSRQDDWARPIFSKTVSWRAEFSWLLSDVVDDLVAFPEEGFDLTTEAWF